MNLDKNDFKILNLLQTDSKMTNKQLSLELNLSSTAVFERIKKLEKSGIIKGYTAVVDRRLLGRELMVFTHVKLERHSKQNISDFESQITGFDEVHECYHVSGDSDYILKMTFRDMDEYRGFIVSKLTSIPSIGSTYSIFVINELKSNAVYKFD